MYLFFQTTWEKPADYVERKSPVKQSNPTETTRRAEKGEVADVAAKEPAKSGSKRFLGLFSKSSSKKNNTETSTSRSATPTDIRLAKSRPNSPSNNNIPQASKQTSKGTSTAETNATNQLVSDLNNTWEVDDVSSVSSEGTSNSIFSAKKMKQALGKVSSRIVGKISNSSPTNTSYDVLDDSFSRKKDAHRVNNKPADDTKQQPKSSAESSAVARPESEEKKPPPDNIEVKPASDTKKKDSQWRSAIDPVTGRTYYFHKITKETVWEKPY
jgi:hypothetical protein